MYTIDKNDFFKGNILESKRLFAFLSYRQKIGFFLEEDLFDLKRKYFKKISLFLEFLETKNCRFLSLALASYLSEPVASVKSSFYYLLGYLPIFRFFGLNPKKLTRAQATKNPILLLHGNYHNQSAFLFLAKKILKKNLGPVFTINLHSGSLTEEDRLLIEEKILEIQREYARYRKKPTIDLVGHSRGAEMAFCIGMAKENWNIDQGKINIDTEKNAKNFAIGKVIRLGLSTSPTFRKKIAKEYLKTIYEVDAAFDMICKKEERSSQFHTHRYVASCGHLGLLQDKHVLEKVINWLAE